MPVAADIIRVIPRVFTAHLISHIQECIQVDLIHEAMSPAIEAWWSRQPRQYAVADKRSSKSQR